MPNPPSIHFSGGLHKKKNDVFSKVVRPYAKKTPDMGAAVLDLVLIVPMRSTTWFNFSSYPDRSLFREFHGCSPRLAWGYCSDALIVGFQVGDRVVEGPLQVQLVTDAPGGWGCG